MFKWEHTARCSFGMLWLVLMSSGLTELTAYYCSLCTKPRRYSSCPQRSFSKTCREELLCMGRMFGPAAKTLAFCTAVSEFDFQHWHWILTSVSADPKRQPQWPTELGPCLPVCGLNSWLSDPALAVVDLDKRDGGSFLLVSLCHSNKYFTRQIT